MHGDKSTRRLTVRITPEMRQETTARALDLMREITRVRNAKLQLMHEHNDNLRKLHAELSEAMNMAESESVERDVECIELHVMETRQVKIVRLDNKETVDQREMTGAELQVRIPGTDDV